MDFSTLKKKSSDLTRLSKQIEKVNSGADRSVDTRFWKLTRDTAGNGYAVIRFLPQPAVDGEDGMPWVQVWDHGFQGPTGKWYIENSLTTIGRDDPVSEFNGRLWKASNDDDSPERKQARAQKRRLHFISNILVVNDPANPENNGKVFLFKYGKKIFKKIESAMHPDWLNHRAEPRPDLGDEPAFNPFDLEAGANFKLKMRTVAGYPNYDEAVFVAPTPVATEESKLVAIWKSEHSLKAFVDPNGVDHRGEPLFKPYDVLKKKFEEVLGMTPGRSAPVQESKTSASADVPPWEDEVDPIDRTPSPALEKTPSFDEDEDLSDELAKFKGMLKDN